MKEFHSFLHFAEHLVTLIPEMLVAQHESLEHAAKIVEKEAKREIGTYQEAAGQFAGWAELSDYTKEDRLRQGFTENDPGLRSGEMRDSIQHRAGITEAHIGSDDDKLVWFELGTSKQPPRSVLGIAAVNKSDEVIDIVGEFVSAALAGEKVYRGRIEIE